MLNRFRSLQIRRWQSNSTIKRFIEENQSIAHTTVFQGTLYEHTVMRELQDKLAMNKLRITGGANDRGVDIKGTWNVSKIFDTMNPILRLGHTEVPLRCKFNGASFKPFRHKLPRETQLKVLVQCKAFTSLKVAPKEFRELLGTFASLVSGPQRNKTAIIMCSPNLLTKNGLRLINSVTMPLIYLRIEMLRLKGAEYDIADSGRLLNYYENEYAAQFLQGMGIKEWFKLSMFR